MFDTIGGFLNGSAGKWDWDDFTSCSLRSAALDQIRRRAAAVELPLDEEGAATLKALLDEVEQFTGDDLTKPKPWRMKIGLIFGFLAGAILWWSSFVSGGGWFQNPHIVVLPMALGVAAVSWRNRRAKVGFYDPEIIERNKQGRA
ncbi:MAG TPA: hypothetical protein VF475_17665 [Sphingobium sp.]